MVYLVLSRELACFRRRTGCLGCRFCQSVGHDQSDYRLNSEFSRDVAKTARHKHPGFINKDRGPKVWFPMARPMGGCRESVLSARARDDLPRLHCNLILVKIKVVAVAELTKIVLSDCVALGCWMDIVLHVYDYFFVNNNLKQ
jgi:hypothetical protein